MNEDYYFVHAQMKLNEDYDTEYFWEDNDNQDGTFFREFERHFEGNYTFDSGRDQKHEERKLKAALYIRAHFDELMNNEDYRTAYYKLVDEFAREYSFLVDNKPLKVVTEKERELEGSALDFQIETDDKRKIEKYKDDAIYIVDWVKSGKSLTVYIN